VTTVRKTLSELAQLVDGRVIGDAGVEICGMASIEEAGPGDITFLVHPRYRSYLESCQASAIIIGEGFPIETPEVSGRGFLQVSHPYIAFAKILKFFKPPNQHDAQISPGATIDPTAILGGGSNRFSPCLCGETGKGGSANGSFSWCVFGR